MDNNNLNLQTGDGHCGYYSVLGGVNPDIYLQGDQYIQPILHVRGLPYHIEINSSDELKCRDVDLCCPVNIKDHKKR